jgi:iron complex outermembrane receptor protein
LNSSPSYWIFGVLAARQIGPLNVFVNVENLSDERVTRVHSVVLPSRAPDGSWTTDAWAPLDGRVFNAGVRWRFGADHD